MPADALTIVIHSVTQHCASAEGARDLAESLAENAMAHGWDTVAEGYESARELLSESATELGTLASTLRATAPVLARVRQDKSYPGVSTDLETAADALVDATSAIEGIGRHLDDALYQANLVGSDHMSARLQTLLDDLQETDAKVRALATEIEAEIQAARSRTGPAVGPPTAPATSVSARIEQLKREGHAPQRHGPQVTDQQLTDRALYGIDPMTGTTTDGEHGGVHGYGRDATKFVSDEALLRAADVIRSSHTYNTARRVDEDTGLGQIRVEVPLSTIFGPDYREQVRGIRRGGTRNLPTGDPPGDSPPGPVDFTDGTMFAYFRRAPDGEYSLITMYPRPKD